MDQLKILNTVMRDSATGFIGTVTAVVFYAKQDPRALLEALDKNGRPVDLWTELARLEDVES